MNPPLKLRSKMTPTSRLQRLTKPTGNDIYSGGGLKNLGLSPKAVDLLSPVFGFDYMGDAGFEFGAIPQALTFIWTEAQKNRFLFFGSKIVSGSYTQIHYICPRTYKPSVKKTIEGLLTNEDKMGLDRPCGLQTSLDQTNSQPDVVGWLEVDNGFFLFTNKNMFQKTKKLFTKETILNKIRNNLNQKEN